MEQRKRLRYFDMVKGVAIVLVVIGHIVAFPPHMRVWIFSFHMPLFFVISGMLMHYRHDEEKPMKEVVKKRLRSIGIPYAWFSLMYFSVVVYAFFISKTILIDTLLINAWYVLGLSGMVVLWFLPTLFFSEVLMVLLLKKLPKKAVPFAAVILGALAMAAGFWLKDFKAAYAGIPSYERLLDFMLTVSRPFFALLFTCAGYYSFYLFRHEKACYVKELILGVCLLIATVPLSHVIGATDMRSMNFCTNEAIFPQLNGPLYILAALCGSFAIIFICKNVPPLKPLEYFGKNSLVIMAVHNNSYALYYGTLLAMSVNQYVTRAREYIYGIVILAVIMLFSAVVSAIINRFFPFVLGRPWKTPFHKKI